MDIGLWEGIEELKAFRMCRINAVLSSSSSCPEGLRGGSWSESSPVCGGNAFVLNCY